MEEQTNQLTNGVKKDFKNIWAIILAVVITSFITGGSVYVWQNQQAKKLQDQIRQFLKRRYAEFEDVEVNFFKPNPIPES